jgi:hypothetical protein
MSDLFSCTPDDPRAVRFADYIVHNYIEATYRYPPAILSEPSLDSVLDFPFQQLTATRTERLPLF